MPNPLGRPARKIDPRTLGGKYVAHLEISGVEDVPVSIYYRHHKAHAGKTDGKYGPKLEPDEPECLEIDWCELDDGRQVDLTAAQEAAVLEEIGDWLQGYYDEPEPEGAHDGDS